MSLRNKNNVPHLPDECWEQVLKFFDHYRYFEHPSLLSKQLLSITNNLRSSLTISDQTRPYISRFFTRFPNLLSLNLDLTRYTTADELDALLHVISESSLSLQSLDISHHTSIPVNGFRDLGKKMKTLKYLSCLNISSLSNVDDVLILIADCFPFIEELHVHCIASGLVSEFSIKTLSLALPKLRKINFSGNCFFQNVSLFHLCKNCEFLEQVMFHRCNLLTQPGIVSAIKERPNLTLLSVVNYEPQQRIGSDLIASLVNLKSLSCLDLSYWIISDELLFSIAKACIPLIKLVLLRCFGYTYVGLSFLLSKCQLVQHLDLESAEFLEDEHVSNLSVLFGNLIFINLSSCKKLTNLSIFALTRNCPLLSGIRMMSTSLGDDGIVYSLKDFVVNSRMKSLDLSYNSWLWDGSIKVFASICPNLDVLKLDSFKGTPNSILEVLKRCPKIRDLSLADCSRVELLFGMMNFQCPNLEVLKLSRSNIDDESLFMISKKCHKLLNLDLENCSKITTKGVIQVVKSCKQLRNIKLTSCQGVFACKLLSRPSLKIFG
ncbi:hypothetical protein Lal_00013240 [Lupinus albus]|uniref:Putative leucine-rich repeat domain, L domain-containing protein n=1 Tax=Lupinus albus TaxID=3870 RepID=A0A6A5P040_LUPAL|nr:putative leucine-rich repeat domain, L domain-containing protein [Lupinus albus]KAF1890645.1 hypothetical protein Lal_00013240 [Lupinus albus]